MILIKSTFKIAHLSVCKVVFITKIAHPIRFLESLKYFCAFILCVSDSGLQCNKPNSYWYVGQLVGFLMPWKMWVYNVCVRFWVSIQQR